MNTPIALNIIVLIVGLAISAESASETILGCTTIDNDADRLACYDAVAGRVSNAPAPLDGGATTATASPEKSPTVPSRPPRRPVEDPAEIGALDADSQFGLTDEREQFRKLESRAVGRFTGWTGSTKVQLENGQVWRQTDNFTASWSIESPQVTISRTITGGYRMRVEGLNRRVAVKRTR